MNDQVPSGPVTPVGLNHLVINVRDIEESHRSLTDLIGLRQVGEIPPGLGGMPRGVMRFYSGERDGKMHHHDIALVHTPDLRQPEGPNPIGHIAIALPDRESWLR
jgi:catechol 2,3-dioxygenase-like lactoylglutathione lyase family enzyme